jgi:DNA-binding NarL/FixJ family response regulator
MGGVDVTRRIVARWPRIAVVGLSMHTETRVVAEMLQAGARGYVVKDGPVADLSRAIVAAASGKAFLGAGATEAVVGDYLQLRLHGSAAPGASLTPRERDVLRLIAAGRSTKEIAAELKVSTKTVETFRRSLMDKAGVDSVAGLTKYAVRIGLASLD